MKKIEMLLLSLILTMTYFMQGQIQMGTPETIALQTPWGNTRPRIVLNANADPVVIWSNPNSKNVYVSRKSNGVFLTPIKLNPDGMELSVFDWSGPEIAANGNNVFVVFKQIPEHTSPVFCVRSSDGGTTWSDTVRVDSSSPLMSRMPAVGVDSNGNPIVAFMRENMDNGYSDWAVSRSLDGGVSFEPAFTVTSLTGGAVCDCCPATVVSSGSNVAVIYRNNDVNLRDIRASISNDGGATFDANIDMDDLDWEVNVCPSSGPDGYFAGTDLKSAWMSKASGYNRIYFSSGDTQSSTSGGSVLVRDAPSTQIQNRPVIAGNESVMGIAGEYTQLGMNEIFFSWSSSDFTENNYFAVTPNLAGNQLRPDIAFDGQKFHLVFTDNGILGVTYMQLEIGGVNVDDLKQNSNFTLMPNPANEQIGLQIVGQHFSASAQIEVIDMSGRSVFQESLGNSPVKILSTGQLSDGIYSYVIRDHGILIANMRFIIQH